MIQYILDTYSNSINRCLATMLCLGLRKIYKMPTANACKPIRRNITASCLICLYLFRHIQQICSIRLMDAYSCLDTTHIRPKQQLYLKRHCDLSNYWGLAYITHVRLVQQLFKIYMIARRL